MRGSRAQDAASWMVTMVRVIIQDGGSGDWLHFGEPRAVLQTDRPDEVLGLLATLAARVTDEGQYAAGFISYEAAPAFDPALTVRSGSGLPLAWFGLFDRPQHRPLAAAETGYQLGAWAATDSAETYAAHIAAIRQAIAQGLTYQVNYTYRLCAPFAGEPYTFFLDLATAQRGGYAAYIDNGTWAVCCAAPELFFRLDGERLTTRPMKGTLARGLTLADDQAQMAALRRSEKNRAENVMIVDMLRNDLGRVARLGSVHVPRLFEVTRYPTLHQMTSTITAASDAPFPAIMQALFPCASITGAPKVRTMQLIRDLESKPRGVYCGTIGYLAPGRQAQFNVAIRTALVDRCTGQAEYGVGGGIVWDSEAGDEYRETLLKARVLTAPRPAFALLESLLWTPQAGYWLLEGHVGRMVDSAEYFQFPLQADALRQTLRAYAIGLNAPAKVRVTLAPDGQLAVSHTPPGPSAPVRLGLAARPVERRDPFLYHKTTHRAVYTTALAACPDCDDVLLWNAAGEITETTTANVAIRRGGRWVTPPVSAGLLGGVLRARLLAEGALQEGTITIEEARQQAALWLINSVRGWRPAHW